MLDYADLLSGDSIPIENMGHVHSPRLYEILSPKGIGLSKYALYVDLFAWNKDKFLSYAKQTSLKGLQAFDKADKLECYDVMTLLAPVRVLLSEAISFFMDEINIWDDKERAFIILNTNNERVGIINRNNFQQLADIILELNYITKDKKKMSNKESSKIAQSRWEEAQKFIKQQKPNKKENQNSEYSLGNIISKLCCMHSSYNLTNVFNLTIYQLYDQFAQVSYLRRVNLEERIFTIHGGDKFKPDNWLKTINKK